MTAASSLPPTTWSTSGEVIAGLRRHYCPDIGWDKGSFCPEIQAPRSIIIGPRGGRRREPARRADLIWIPREGNRVTGHEVKVTRADLRHELEDLTKSEAWKRYCTQWYLVVGNVKILGVGMEMLDKIPADWGVLGPPTGRRTRSLSIIREAPELNPVTTGPGLTRVASWSAWRRYEDGLALTAMTRERDHYKRRLLDGQGPTARERELRAA